MSGAWATGPALPRVGARRCIYCNEKWPRTDEYIICPCCREETKLASSMISIAPEVAAKRKAHFDFGWWLWDTGRL